ncbi:MAG TPA: N-acetylmuramoyl-L-alanine amidase [Firmicutes bacterium]|nr:N-acetylmuramoyl-L-alanine amidase [Bacillota bacterium]
MRIVLDAGHGGGKGQGDPGAVDPVQPAEGDMLYTEEDDLAFDIARRAQEALMLSGHTAHLTRRPNQFISLQGRCDLANRLGADVFVSIHLNAGPPTARGFEVFSYPGSCPGAQLRDAILGAIAKAFPDWVNRGAKEANYAVLRGTKMPAALVECGFVTNTEEERKLHDPAVRQRMAEAIAAGVIKYGREKHGRV